MGGKKNRKGPRSAAAVAPVSSDEPEPRVGYVAGVGEDDFPPLPSVEAARGSELTAGMGSSEEKGDDSSPEREEEGEVEKLKALNSMLVTEAMEERGKVAALAALVDEQSADAAVLAGVERVVSRTAIEEPFLAAAEENEVLKARLADVVKMLEDAETRLAREMDARGEAMARLEAAAEEKRQVLELLAAKDAEAVAASKDIAELKALVDDLAGKSIELIAERGELEKQLIEVRGEVEKQLEEMSVSVQLFQTQKEDLEESFKEFKKNSEMKKQDMEEKLEAKSGELHVLITSKAELESKFGTLQAELLATMSKNGQLELEMVANKTQLAAANSKVEKLRSEVSDVGKKHTMMVAEVNKLRIEIDEKKTMKEEAVSALTAEKTKLERELHAMKRKIDLIEANKEAVMGMADQKDAEAAALRAELDSLRSSIDELHSLCAKHDADSSSLQVEKDAVLKALDDEKAEGVQLRLRIRKLENYNGEKDRVIGVLKAEIEGKKGHIHGLNGKVEQLQLAVVEAKQRKKGGVWTWLCPATTTVIAAASFAYATRRR